MQAIIVWWVALYITFFAVPPELTIAMVPIFLTRMGLYVFGWKMKRV